MPDGTTCHQVPQAHPSGLTSRNPDTGSTVSPPVVAGSSTSKDVRERRLRAASPPPRRRQIWRRTESEAPGECRLGLHPLNGRGCRFMPVGLTWYAAPQVPSGSNPETPLPRGVRISPTLVAAVCNRVRRQREPETAAGDNMGSFPSIDLSDAKTSALGPYCGAGRGRDLCIQGSSGGIVM
jgi:hypothetical protein